VLSNEHFCVEYIDDLEENLLTLIAIF